MLNFVLTSLFSIVLDPRTGIKPAYHVKLMLFFLIITYETIILITVNCFLCFFFLSQYYTKFITLFRENELSKNYDFWHAYSSGYYEHLC